jgi:hypothetical protein
MRTLRAVLCVLLVVVAGCSPSRFEEAAQTIARQTGRDAPEIENAFREALPGANEEKLAAAAEGAASRDTWVEQLGARLAADSELRANLRAVTGATCDAIRVYKDLGDATTPADLQDVIVKNIREQHLPETGKKIAEIAEGVLDQLDSLQNGGVPNLDAAAVDLACVLYG